MLWWKEARNADGASRSHQTKPQREFKAEGPTYIQGWKGRKHSRSYKQFSVCGAKHCRRARGLQEMIGPVREGLTHARPRILDFVLRATQRGQLLSTFCQLRFNRIAVCINGSFLFIAGWYSIASVGTHLNWFQILAFTNKATLNIYLQLFIRA